VYVGTDRVDSLLEEGFRIEGSGWKAEQGTAIAERLERVRFYTDVAHWAAERGWLRLTFLRLDDVGIAFDFALESRGSHHVLKTGYDASFARHGPGSVLRYTSIRDAFADPDIHTYNLMGTVVGGRNNRKLNWTDECRVLENTRLFAPTQQGRALYALDRGWRAVGQVRAGIASSLSPEFKDMIRRSLSSLRRRGSE